MLSLFLFSQLLVERRLLLPEQPKDLSTKRQAIGARSVKVDSGLPRIVFESKADLSKLSSDAYGTFRDRSMAFN